MNRNQLRVFPELPKLAVSEEAALGNNARAIFSPGEDPRVMERCLEETMDGPVTLSCMTDVPD